MSASEPTRRLWYVDGDCSFSTLAWAADEQEALDSVPLYEYESTWHVTASPVGDESILRMARHGDMRLDDQVWARHGIELSLRECLEILRVEVALRRRAERIANNGQLPLPLPSLPDRNYP